MTMKSDTENLIYEVSLRARRFIATIDKKNKGKDLSPREIIIMDVIKKNDKMTISQIENALPMISRATVSNAITTLWRNKKLVTKTIDPENQRTRVVSLTTKGQSALRSAKESREELFKTFVKALDLRQKELEIFDKGLRNVINFFDKQIELLSKDRAAKQRKLKAKKSFG